MIALALQVGLAASGQGNRLSGQEIDVVVVGSRLSDVDVFARIEAAEIDRLQPVALTDLIDRLPGVHAVTTSGLGGGSFVSVRGGDPNFTLVLIDGVRVNDSSNVQGGGFDFAQLDPGLVQGISLVPVSASAVHGSDALGGVISLRMRSPYQTGPSASGRTLVDNRRGFQMNSSLGYGWQDGGVSISGGILDSGHLSRGSNLERQHLFGRVRHSIDSFELSTFVLHAATERTALPEASGGPLFAASADRERRNTRLTVAGLTFAGSEDRALQPHLQLGWYSQFTDSDTPRIPSGVLQEVPAIATQTWFRRLQASASIRYLTGHGIDLALGADYQREEGRSIGTIDFGFPLQASFRLMRQSAGMFAEAQWRPIPQLDISAAIRHDRFRDFGETTPRISVSLRPGSSLPVLQVSYAEGFKLPSIYALASPLIGNPGLRPERSHGHQVTLWKAFMGGEARLTYFRTRYRDLIDFDVDQFISVNRFSVFVEGVEIVMRGRLAPNLELAGNVTYTATESAAVLRSRPRWQGAAQITWQSSSAWVFELFGRANGPVVDASIPTGTVTLAGHVTLGGVVRWTPSPGISVTATVENIAGQSWQEAVGFPVPGRLARISIAGSF